MNLKQIDSTSMYVMTLQICMYIMEDMAENGVQLSEYGIWEVSHFIN